MSRVNKVDTRLAANQLIRSKPCLGPGSQSSALLYLVKDVYLCWVHYDPSFVAVLACVLASDRN